MPPRKKKNPAADAALPTIPSELIDQIVKGPMSAEPPRVSRRLHHLREWSYGNPSKEVFT